MGAGASTTHKSAVYAVKATEATATVEVNKIDRAAEVTTADTETKARAIWDDLTSFESHLSHGCVIAALQMFAALFNESGMADAIEITVETTILQQVSNFQFPLQSLLKAIEAELQPVLQSHDDAFAKSVPTASSSVKSAAPPDFGSKVADLQKGMHSATHQNKHLLHQMKSVDFSKVKQVLEVLGADGVDCLGKLDVLIRCTQILATNTQTLVQASETFYTKAKAVESDIADIKQVSLTNFGMHMEVAYNAAKQVALAAEAEATAGKAFVEGVKAFVEAVEALYSKLKDASNEHEPELEAQLAALQSLPQLALEASTGTDSAHAAISKLEIELETYAKDSCEEAFSRLLSRLDGGSSHSGIEETIRNALISALSSLVRDTVKTIAAKVFAIAAHVCNGKVSETVGFMYESFLSLRFTIVADLDKVVEILNKLRVAVLKDGDSPCQRA